VITDKRAQEAVDFLLSNAEEAGRLRANYEFEKERRKSVWSMCFNYAEGKTNADKEAQAYRNTEYLEQLDRIREAAEAFEINRAKREAAKCLLDAFQTMSANHRQIRV
jgi:hypothetical protein